MVYLTHLCSQQIVKYLWSTTWARLGLGLEKVRDVGSVPACEAYGHCFKPWKCPQGAVSVTQREGHGAGSRVCNRDTCTQELWKGKDWWLCVCPSNTLPTNTRNPTDTHKSRPTQTRSQVIATQARLANKQTLTRNLSHQTCPSWGKTWGL